MDVDTAELDAQIARLQAAKRAIVEKGQAAARARDKEAARVLVGSTPTKKEKRATPAAAPPKAPPQPKFTLAAAGPSRLPYGKKPPAPESTLLPPAATRKSALAERLAAKRARANPAPKAGADGDNDLEIVRNGTERADDLTVAHDLRLGPPDHGTDPDGSDEWRDLEPNSRIRLSERVASHADVQNTLYGRYYLPPSQIYSVARLSRDGATYDIPVDNDWVTIAVVAERSDVRVSGTKDAGSDEDDDGVENGSGGGAARDKKAKWKGKGKGKDTEKRRRALRKYINLKLVSMPPRSKGAASSTTGDAFLQLLLFEADAVVHGKNGEDKSYRGGSGGAYERWVNLAVGSVIALVNPRVMRPLQSGAGAPHPLTLPLGLNPISAASITLIGHAKDLGRCVSVKRDGSRCRSWVDSRVGQVCEYHVHAAVKRGRGGRGEFASATTSYELETRDPGKATDGGGGKGGRGGSGSAYNPRTKTGLKPKGPAVGPGGGATYVVGTGKVVRTGDSGKYTGFGPAFLDERMGRNQAALRKRKMEQREQDAVLERLFGKAGKDGKGESADAETQRKRVFSTEAVQRMGFDPTGYRVENAVDRAASIAALRKAAERPIKLGRLPGPRQFTTVRAPVQPATPAPSASPKQKIPDDDGMIDLD